MLKDTSKITLNTKPAKLAELKVGDQVDLDLDTDDNVLKVSATRAKQ